MIKHNILAVTAFASLCLSAAPIALASDDPAIVIINAKTTPVAAVKKSKDAEAKPAAGLDGNESSHGAKAADTSANASKGAADAKDIAKAAPKNPLPLLPMSSKERDRAEHCLALNIYHEARSEPRKGQEAVAAVTINRVASSKFPDSVCGVVQQGGKKLNRCQFSWWCDRHSDKPREAKAWARAKDLSREALDGKLSDPTNGALYYHANYVKPKWSRTFHKTSKIGRHLFYKPRGA